jgi:hypothetical protein
MSDDRKPGRVRLVAGSGGRTTNEPVPDKAAIAGSTTAEAVDATEGKGKGGGKAALLPAALFLIGCIGGGVAVARLVP